MINSLKQFVNKNTSLASAMPAICHSAWAGRGESAVYLMN